MNINRILIVEDESKVADFIKRGLEENGFECDIAYDGEMGKRLAINSNYSVIIMDINLPLINGFELCKILRTANISMPILMLTAMGTTDDKLQGFDSGADDYLVKPFEFRELLARIKSLIKRSTSDKTMVGSLSIADLELNSETKVVKRSGKKIELTAKEFSLLEYLIRNTNRVITRGEIAEKIWDIKFDTGTNVIDVYINFLRKKIDKDFDKKLIHTQIGMGYILKIDE